MTVLLVAEHDGRLLNEASARALAAAQQIGAGVDVLVAGSDVADVARQAAELKDVAKVLVADSAALAHQLPEPLAELVVLLAGGYDVIVVPSTAAGRSAAPRIAALLDVMQISDVTKVVSADTFERPTYAGNAIQTVQSTDAKIVLTVRCSAFEPVGAGSAAPVEAVTATPESGRSRFVEETVAATTRPELSSAKVVVSGGRALRSRENFTTYLEPVADRLGAAIGASRAAVDAGYAPNNWQVGQTGKIVAPDLYIAAGISGAIQHLAGMKDAKVIVAINSDADAPIFQVADYGLVADLFTAMPALDEELAKAAN